MVLQFYYILNRWCLGVAGSALGDIKIAGALWCKCRQSRRAHVLNRFEGHPRRLDDLVAGGRVFSFCKLYRSCLPLYVSPLLPALDLPSAYPSPAGPNTP